MNIKDSVKTVDKKDTKESKSKVDTKKNEKKEKIRNVYLMDYYIKDLTTDRFIETNIDKYKGNEYNMVVYKGKRPVLEGLSTTFAKVEDALGNMKAGDKKTLTLEPSEAYGIRKKEMLKVVPYRVFKESNLRPIPGLTIDVGEGQHGTIRSVSGGRVLVDFNSPYADHKIEFYLKKAPEPKEEDKAGFAIKALMPQIKIKNTQYTKPNLKITLDKKEYKEEHIKGFEQILLGTLKNYIKIEKVEVILG